VTWAVRPTTSPGCRDPHCRPLGFALCESRWRSGVEVAMATETRRLRRRASERDRSGSGAQHHLNAWTKKEGLNQEKCKATSVPRSRFHHHHHRNGERDDKFPNPNELHPRLATSTLFKMAASCQISSWID
jgi:hypothetical protein